MVEYTQPANATLAEDGLNLCTAQETVFIVIEAAMWMGTESCCRIFSSFKVMILILKLQKKKKKVHENQW